MPPAEGDGMELNMKVVYFSPIAFSDLKQRPQYFAEGLSNKHKVHYIEPTKRILSYIKNKEGCAYVKYNINENLTIFRCDGAIVLPFRWNVYDILYLNGIYEYLQLKKIVADADVVIVGFEGWYNVVKRIKNKKIIYDKMDENALLSTDWENRTYLQRSEKALLKKCVSMITSAKVFEKKYQKRLPVYLVPNAFDRKDASYIQYKESKGNKVIYGYVGAIADWFDNKAIEVIAKDKNNQVILVGPCRTEKIQKDNVIYVGKVDKSDVATYIKSFDICLYPFKKGELLDTINPVKIYEYLSLNKPIIAIDSEETKAFDASIYTYQNYTELENLCNRKLSQPFDSEEKYEKFMESNSWENRIDIINEILEELK